MWCPDLDLDAVAHVDGDDVAAVECGEESRAGLRRSLDEALWSRQVQLARDCNSKHNTETVSGNDQLLFSWTV